MQYSRVEIAMKCRKEGIEDKDASVHPRITVRAVLAAWSHTGVNTRLRQEDVLKNVGRLNTKVVIRDSWQKKKY